MSPQQNLFYGFFTYVLVGFVLLCLPIVQKTSVPVLAIMKSRLRGRKKLPFWAEVSRLSAFMWLPLPSYFIHPSYFWAHLRFPLVKTSRLKKFFSKLLRP